MDKKSKKQLKHEKFLKKQQMNIQYKETKKSIAIIKETYEKTPPGDYKKFTDMKNYDAEYVEHGWYDYWLKEEHFKDRPERTKSFSIIMPPPNITGKLHIGHALMLSIQDTIIRYKRMMGYNAHYVPGVDHAGIATQSVVERTVERIIAEGCGPSKYDKIVYDILEKGETVENFSVKDILKDYLDERMTGSPLEKKLADTHLNEGKRIKSYGSTLDIPLNKKLSLAYSWSSLHSNIILSQIMKMGTSCDWNHLTFTMDSHINDIVNENFKKLYRDGLIQQKNRIVNYSHRLKSVISLIEVDNEPVNAIQIYEKYNEKTILGIIYKLKYPIRRKSKQYRAIQLTDKLYENRKYDGLISKLYGGDIKEACEELENEYIENFNRASCEGGDDLEYLQLETTRPETILGDTAIAVHPTLYEQYREYEAVNPLTGQAIPIFASSKVDKDFGTGIVKLTPGHDKFDFELCEGKQFEAVTIIDRNNNISYLGRTFNRFYFRHVVIALLNRTGMLIAINPIKNTVPLCSRTGAIIESIIMKQWYILTSKIKIPHEKLKVYPNEKMLVNYLNNMEDWCISRQIWWGHPIPIYEKDGEYNVEGKGTLIGDVFDTWFSAALYPAFFKYPSSVLETGRDILLFWVVKMLLVNYQLTKVLPFNEVLLHGLVRDKDNKKMSKSLGNAIDPIDIIDGVSLDSLKNNISIILNKKERERTVKYIEKEFPDGIKECGADALRMSLCRMYNPYSHRDIQYSYRMAEDYRVYMNKIWNASKLFFIENNNSTIEKEENMILFTDYTKYKFNQTIKKIHKHMESYNLMEVLKELYTFSYYFFDIHIELMKLYNNYKESSLIFCHMMQIYSVFMPFMSEEIMQRHKNKFMHNFDSINLNDFPSYENYEKNSFAEVLEEVQLLKKDSSYEIKNKNFTAEIEWLAKK